MGAPTRSRRPTADPEPAGGPRPRGGPARPRAHRRGRRPAGRPSGHPSSGALITYSVSIDQRVQELEEVWWTPAPVTYCRRRWRQAGSQGSGARAARWDGASRGSRPSSSARRRAPALPGRARSAELARQTASRRGRSWPWLTITTNGWRLPIEERRLKARPNERGCWQIRPRRRSGNGIDAGPRLPTT